MLECFFPDIYVDSIYALPLEMLKEKGIRALVFDIDNTVVPYDIADANEDIVNLFQSFRAQGFRLCLLSNNNKKRVHLFNEKLKVLAVPKAGKPGIKKLKKAMELMGTNEKTTALIGDQVFTDMYCGNRAGLYTILTKPICNRDQFVTKIKRGAEKQVIKIYLKRRPPQ